MAASRWLLLSVLWWAWPAYAWLTNTVDPEEGAVAAHHEKGLRRSRLDSTLGAEQRRIEHGQQVVAVRDVAQAAGNLKL